MNLNEPGTTNEETDLNLASATALIYGLLMVGGGAMAYRRVGSVPSLVGGLVVGAFSILGAFSMIAGQVSGRGIAMLGGIIALLFFGWSLSRGILDEKTVKRAAALLALSALDLSVLFWSA